MPDWYSQPPVLVAIIFVAVGFYGLIKGANVLVEGAVAIAKRFGMAPVVIGATIVAFGTSLPEMAVSVGSNLKALIDGGDVIGDDSPAAIALGNIVGSNIFNVGCILGIVALIRPLPVPRATRRFDYPIMLTAIALLIGFAFIGHMSNDYPAILRWEGALLVAGLIFFTVRALRSGRVDAEELEAIESGDHGVGASIGLIIVGMMLLTIGGDVSLNGAISLAQSLGMSQRVIGLTVMAIGTSLPELVTSIQAVRKGHTDIALGNVVGSNIFNVFCVLGVSALVIPLPVSPTSLHWDLWWMLGINLLIIPALLVHQVQRWHGALLLTILTTYVVWTIVVDQQSVHTHP